MNEKGVYETPAKPIPTNLSSKCHFVVMFSQLSQKTIEHPLHQPK